MADNPQVRLENLPQAQRNSRGFPSIGPLYMNTTTPRSGEPYTDANLAGARDVFGALSQSSQFKISLHLSANGSAGDENLNAWLQASGLTVDPVQNEYYNFYCAEANLPGSAMQTVDIKGNFQGMTERLITERTFLPVSFTFYVDNDYRLIRLFEEWMNYINPLHGSGGAGTGGAYSPTTIGHGNAKFSNDISRLRYPDSYRRIISITKFERDFREQPQRSGGKLGDQSSITYRLIDAFPTQISGVPLSYEGSTISKVTVQFDYTRYVYELNPDKRTFPAGTRPSPKVEKPPVNLPRNASPVEEYGNTNGPGTRFVPRDSATGAPI